MMARRRTARGASKGVTYDARTGMKVKGLKLKEDGERPGLWTTDRDGVHPQRFVVAPGPDGANLRPGIPDPHNIPVTVTAPECEPILIETITSGITIETS